MVLKTFCSLVENLTLFSKELLEQYWSNNAPCFFFLFFDLKKNIHLDKKKTKKNISAQPDSQYAVPNQNWKQREVVETFSS